MSIQTSNIIGSCLLRSPTLQIPDDWLDYNGHVTENRYLSLCGFGTDNLLAYVGINPEYRSKFGSYFTVETHLSHLGELHAGDRVDVITQVLGADPKRLHLFHFVTREKDGITVATGEQMLLHVTVSTGRSGPAEASVCDRILQLARLHAQLPRPGRAGAKIAMR